MAFKNDNFINTVELGRAIKRRREELGLSLRDVADVTGVSASTLSRIENGTGKPDADNIARLTGWLDMPIDRVMNKQAAADVDAVVYYPHEATPRLPPLCIFVTYEKRNGSKRGCRGWFFRLRYDIGSIFSGRGSWSDRFSTRPRLISVRSIGHYRHCRAVCDVWRRKAALLDVAGQPPDLGWIWGVGGRSNERVGRHSAT